MVLDTFVQGVGRVEEVAPNLFRVSYIAHQQGYDGTQERVCVAKFIIPLEAMLTIAQDMAGRQLAARTMKQTHSPAH
ncbi:MULTISPECIES: hypothetical protein [unclassified Mesorhizobium]|uniref:hypothetical protein n=1 Tax=unclassified Mesorhizobium TaxID=325217 RepID=UPI000FCA2515|nr:MULTISPECIES: hypothetical protein [unclassified Mesorhizobium]RVD54548.1 hypothetical protein EN783_30430 [Mesorhizobium sp. M2D.F.Ca.ET.140.01.1.1]TGP69401.1 hypothetical protein EN867_31010 [Mesorhizobium sp. M2D.F.Ca.ET.224.01.1.1]TGP86621.1 hypothetical protein EN865_31005 [bacterium M00.F.Ca.ET.222.01.1.1]